ncbi:MAG: hypothetical protein P1P83_05460 [Bacteroidales bacterium]|nr:hypothetical protein [Bacteroidales bacterium]MDT8374278.1 hypothetical protein [Bacteroidales bacterium]
MKTLNFFLTAVIALLLSSCATTVTFPVSQLAPAAEGSTKIRQDKNGNYNITVRVNYLADAERLNPPRSQYIVWVEKDDGSFQNIGILVSDRLNKAKLETTTPFTPYRILITAEDEGAVTWPGPQELFRSERIIR